LNYKFNDVQSGIATEAASADELSAAKFRLAGRWISYSKEGKCPIHRRQTVVIETLTQFA
jgi:hypothetical protein